MALHALEAGEGRPLVLVHGWPTNGRAWRRQLEDLAAEHRVVALDLPGFGRSPPLERPTVELLARAVRDHLREHGLDDVVLVGWSLGGCVVMSYCKQFDSERLRGIAIVDVSPKLLPGDGWELGVGTPFSLEGLADWRARWESDPRSVATDVYTIGFKDAAAHAADVEWLVEESLKADHATAMDALLDAFECDFRPSLADVDVPALLLYGAASTSTTPGVRTYMEETLPDATLVVFEESSHCPMLEERERFNRVLSEFAHRT